MARAPTESETKRQPNGVANPRLSAATKRALEAHARVQLFAEDLCEELEHGTSLHGIPTTELDPEDSMVIAVEKVITTAMATTPAPIGAKEEVPAARTVTKPGVTPPGKPTGG